MRPASHLAAIRLPALSVTLKIMAVVAIIEHVITGNQPITDRLRNQRVNVRRCQFGCSIVIFGQILSYPSFTSNSHYEVFDSASARKFGR